MTTIMNTEQRVIRFALLAVTAVSAVVAFQPPASYARSTSSNSKTSSALFVAVDPSTVTKKDYEDICGVSFNDEMLKNRLKATNYLYPKHVEVIEDIAPIAGAMVDDVVGAPYVHVLMHCAKRERVTWMLLQLLLAKEVSASHLTHSLCLVFATLSPSLSCSRFVCWLYNNTSAS